LATSHIRECDLKEAETILAAAVWEAQRMLASWRSMPKSKQGILLARLQEMLTSPDVAQALEKISTPDEQVG